MTMTYREACEAYTKAFRKYDPVRRAYHAGKIGDKEFIKARKEFDAVSVAYDEAFAIEAGWKVVEMKPTAEGVAEIHDAIKNALGE